MDAFGDMPLGLQAKDMEIDDILGKQIFEDKYPILLPSGVIDGGNTLYTVLLWSS